MTKIAAFIGLAGVGRQFDVIDGAIAGRIAVFELHVVKYDELRFSSDIYGVADASGLHIGFSALSGRARIASVKFASAGFDNIEDRKIVVRGKRVTVRANLGGPC